MEYNLIHMQYMPNVSICRKLKTELLTDMNRPFGWMNVYFYLYYMNLVGWVIMTIVSIVE